MWLSAWHIKKGVYMPFVKITSSVEMPAGKRDEFLAAVSKAVVEATGKPEQYMMAAFEPGTIMLAGKPGPAAFVDVRAIGGLMPQVNAKISAKLCSLLEHWLKIPAERVYLTFIDVPASNWGHNGDTIG